MERQARDPRKCIRISFVRCLFGEDYSKSCGRSESKGDPAGALFDEEAPGPPAIAKCLQRKST
ncbi:hypothetical protein FSZ17_05230 [Cytobacillus dafuensis]|uniref:Uncharacterized protein n=1 Tax=Cytobacillus dafuensis TaxID=1742359 RepID=A0A5B8Z175_CYTDA|nr:hypothetical protein FSZ17_05230 [Cytobacillus dafuensis]